MTTAFKPSDLSYAIRLKLDNLFSSHQGLKCLYIEQQILQLLNFVLDLKFQQFKNKHEIKQIFSFKFENEKEEIMDQSDSKTIIFFLSPQIKWMRKIAEMVLNNNTRNIQKSYLLLLTPKKSFLCLNQLEEMHVKNYIKIESFNFGLMSLGGDVLSMESSHSYFELFGKSDQTGLQTIAESILKLQYALGDFNHIYGQGDLASSIIDLIRAKDNDQAYQHHESQYNISLIIIDRNVDLVTPFLTPFTYQGMLDNFYNINLNQIMISGDTVDPGANKQLTRYLLYNPLDEIYPELTSMSIYLTQQPLKNKASIYRTKLEEAKENKNISLEQLDSIMKNQGRQYMFIQHHTLLAYSIFKKTKSLIFEKRVTMENQMVQTGNVILENIEHLAAFLTPSDWFRLICLANAVHGGLKEKLIKNIQQIACRMYGIEHVFSVNNMTRCGLLSVFNRNNWSEIKQKFTLINDEDQYDQKNKDYSYIYILYASLMARMVEEVIKNDKAWEDPKYEILKGKTTVVNNVQSNYAKSSKPKLYFVFVVGGVTYGEIHSFKQLSRKVGQRIVVCSTKVTGGKGIVSECFEG